MSSPTISHRLPSELLLLILEHLDSAPPSALNARKEPSLALTSSPHQNLKNVSLVSNRWRDLVLPLLFKHSQLRLVLAEDAREEWQTCVVCGGDTFSPHPPPPPSSSSPSTATGRTRQQDLHREAYHQQLVDDAVRKIREPCIDMANMHRDWQSVSTACRWYHCVQDYLSFLHVNKLEFCVQSFVLVRRTDRLEGHDENTEAADADYQQRAAAALWQHILQKINPVRIVVLASPANLARLTNCAMDVNGSWAFGDMPYHRLDLKIDAATNALLEQAPIDFNALEYIPTKYRGIAGSSLLGLKPWIEIGLNEGSFLSAYGTYHYFEHGAPSLINSIKYCLTSSNGSLHSGAPQHRVSLPALKRLVYTAILPFAHHVDFRILLPCLDELDCQLAPDPENDILTNKHRVGKAQLEDCWQEFFAAYKIISRPFRTHDIQPDGHPRLKKFICRDFQNAMLIEDLDETFLWLCMPCWAEMRPGVFERQAEIPNYEQAPIGF